MRLISLSSGSKGNATVVEIGTARLLVDAGLSCRELTRRLVAAGVDPRGLDGVLVSHEHEDHARGLERFSRKHDVPVFCALETLEALDLSPKAHLAEWRPLNPGEALELDGVRVEPFAVPHDAVRPVGFVIEADGRRIGIATDVGHVDTVAAEKLRGCEAIMLEFNHDERMLEEGPYPWSLKRRVAGRYGHLSNTEAAALLGETVGPECRAVVLAHLSERNNTPDLARRAALAAVNGLGSRIALHVVGHRASAPIGW